jgi:ribosomal subunit interface protein
MQVTVKGRQLDVGQALRTHVEDTLNGLTTKYFGNPIDATAIFSQDAHLYKADISVHAGRGIVVQTTGEADEIYPAFEAAIDKVGKRLQKLKGRMRDHHRDNAVEPAAEYHLQPGKVAEGEEPAGQPPIVAEMPTHIGVMTVAEAVMYMDLADLPALMFRNSAHNELNMVYRRGDGAVGWVDPKGSLN